MENSNYLHIEKLVVLEKKILVPDGTLYDRAIGILYAVYFVGLDNLSEFLSDLLSNRVIVNER